MFNQNFINFSFPLYELTIIILLLIAVPFLTLYERKVLAAMQLRKGPDVVGIWGLLQPFADGFKLILKETVILSNSNKLIFIFSAILALLLSVVNWAILPFNSLRAGLTDINLALLYIFFISSFSVYTIILSGWSSNSRYSFLGALRSSAQMISYEVSIGLILINVLLCVGSLNLVDIINFQKSIWLIIPLFPLFPLFIISALAETNRAPFDLPEAEAELVSGYNVEYSAIGFALFFIGEYANMIFMSCLATVLFLGGWFIFPINFFPVENINFYFLLDILYWWVFSLKAVFVLFIFLWSRAAFPRYRYDQLMHLGWKVFLPLSLSFILFYSGILLSCSGLPN